MQFRQEGRDGALWLLCEDEVSERLGRVRRKGEEGRQADQELFEEGGNSWRRERWSATGLQRSGPEGRKGGGVPGKMQS